MGNISRFYFWKKNNKVYWYLALLNNPKISAKEGINIEQAFHTIAKVCYYYSYYLFHLYYLNPLQIKEDWNNGGEIQRWIPI